MDSELKKRNSNGYHVNFAFDKEQEAMAVQSNRPSADFGTMDAFESYDNSEQYSVEMDVKADKLSCWKQCTRGVRSMWATRLTEDVRGNRDLYIHTTLRELILYILFLITLMIIAFVPINQNTYLLTKTMQNAFLEATVGDTELSLSTVNDLDGLWQVIKEPVLEALYNNHWYNGQPMWPDAGHHSVRYENQLVGLVRMRQLRMSNTSCLVPSDFRKEIKECFGHYDMRYEDKNPFGLKNGTAWTYTAPDVLEMQTFYGDIAVYSGGGFYEDLSRNTTVAYSQVNNLFDHLWLDRGTRAVMIHFTTYNANMNIFCVGQIIIEVPASGGLIVAGEFRSIKLIRYVTPLDFFVLACECIFLLFTLYYIVEEIMEISKHKLSYFTSIWNILDIIIILLSLMCAAFNIYRTIEVNDMLGNLLIESDEFANFQWLTMWQVNFEYGIAVTVFLSWIKLFKYISFNKTMTQLSSTLGNCAKDLAGFAVMFFIVFFSFAELGYLAFGTQVEDFSEFMTSVYTLFRIILGDFDFNALERANNVFGPIFFIVYVFFVFFVLINMFIAIINETYVGVKSDLQKQENEFEVKEFFKKRMKKMLDKMKTKKSRIEKLQQAMELANTQKGGKMDYNELCLHLNANGFTNEEIDNVFGRFDSNNDNQLSSTERLQMQAQLEEEKMALVNQIAQEEQLAIDSGLVEETHRGPPEVTQAEFVKVLKRIRRIEGGMSTVIEHLSTVLQGLSTVEKAKLIRREAMTRLLQTVATDQSAEQDARLSEIVKDGLDQYSTGLGDN